MAADMKNYLRIPVSELTTPTEGRIVYLNRYWVVTDQDEVLFFRSYSCPQCNPDERLAARIAPITGGKVQFIPIAYLPINWGDFG